MVNYCDFSFAWDPEHFREFADRTRCDGAVLCYKGFHPHYLHDNLYAYCREEGGRILEVKEKGHFTPDRTKEYASSGTYYFFFRRAVKQYFAQAMKENLSTNDEFYVSLVYNALIRDGKKALVYDIPFFLQWGTPEDLEDYVYWHRVFETFATWKKEWPAQGPRMVMPMAGSGTRFQGFNLPKPLIPVLGRPMFQTAQHFCRVPKNKKCWCFRKRCALRSAPPVLRRTSSYCRDRRPDRRTRRPNRCRRSIPKRRF